MTTRPRRHSEPEADHADKVVQQISVGFLPAIAEAVGRLAQARGATTSKLLGDAVTDLVTEAASNPAATGHEVRTYSLRLPEIFAGERDPNDTAPQRPGPRPQYTKRLSGYITEDTASRLDDLCARTSMSRARMIRLAVDKALFKDIQRIYHLTTSP